METLMPLWAGV
jgi:hypothetical protein